MDNKKCIKCGSELKIGKFAHNQNTCWSCFKDTVLLALSKLHGEEREAVVFMMAVLAECYKEEW